MSENECSPLQPVVNSTESSLISSFTTSEQLRECFKPRCRVRRVTNKGAILVTVWSFLLSSVYFYCIYFGSKVYSRPLYTVMQVTMGMILPLAGWLADVRFGRYKVIRCSMWIMWISAIVLSCGEVVLSLLNLNNEIFYRRILLILLFPLGIGFGGFQANVIQFGVDQLPDASSSEILTFIVWFAWAFIGSIAAVVTVVVYTSEELKILSTLLVCINLTIALSLNLLFKNVLIVEPTTQNPFKLIYSVVKYAIKNKYPRQRSAFTYCEDELPSRIDFGKMKYGGPFTVEQVEDVKTVFRVMVIILTGCAFHVPTIMQRSIGPNMRLIFLQEVTHSPVYIYSNFYSIAALVLIPLNEVFIYPTFNRCFKNLNSIRKFIIGAVLKFGYYCTFLALITYARHSFTHKIAGASSNDTLPCLFHDNPDFLSETLDYKWTIVLEIILVLSDLFVAIAFMEFFCAQVPYSMKGLIAGCIYSVIGTFMVSSQLMLLPFSSESVHWGTGTLSCGFWYLLTLLVYMLITFTVFGIVAKWYKRRKREDVLPNEHIFAENYYSQE